MFSLLLSFSYSWVKKQLEMPDNEKNFVFIKDQSFAIADHLDSLPKVSSLHTFLIRHPHEMYCSFQELVRRRVDLNDLIPWEECRLDNQTPLFSQQRLL